MKWFYLVLLVLLVVWTTYTVIIKVRELLTAEKSKVWSCLLSDSFILNLAVGLIAIAFCISKVLGYFSV